MKKTFRKILWVVLALALVLGACVCSLPGLYKVPTSTPAPAPTSSNPNPLPSATPSQQPLAPAGIYPPPFATYSEVAVNLPDTFNGGGYTLPVDLSQVQGLDLTKLTDSQRALLAQNGFVVTSPVAGEFREFYQIYEGGRYMEMPMFITTDSVFHVYHLIFDKMLRDLETGYFIADLKSLTTTMLAASTAQYQSLKGSALEEPGLRNAAYFAVADRLLGLSDTFPAEAADMVNAELALINAGSTATFSPIWDRPDLTQDMRLIEDYSQYIPRGHYTRSEDLKTYFKAMMWYGRLTFRQADDFETRRALLLVRTPRNLERRLRWGDWFLREIVARGKVLYEPTDHRVDQEGRGRRHLRGADQHALGPGLGWHSGCQALGKHL